MITSGRRRQMISWMRIISSGNRSIGPLAATIKARWVCEQALQQLKQELGLDHFEGRSWTGLHRHALMTCIACAYLQHLRLKTARGEKSAAERAAAQTNTPCIAPCH